MINLPAGSGRQPLLLDLLEEKQQRPVSDSELMHRCLLPPSFPSELVLWLLIPLLQNKSVGLHRISLPSFSLFLLSSCVNSTFTFHASSGSFSFTLSVAQFSRSAWCFPVACSGDINSAITCPGRRADICSSAVTTGVLKGNWAAFTVPFKPSSSDMSCWEAKMPSSWCNELDFSGDTFAKKK